MPRVDAEGKPVLPARTLQGALRSQSERILRTLGIACCGAGGVKSCADNATKAARDFCLACQLYGNSKQAARLTQPSPPKCECPGFVGGDEFHKRDFIAIDRFTGGGKDGAKFDAESAYKPIFSATLNVANDTCDAAHGLLLLTLRDLAEGDVPLGWGKRKGYGDCTAAGDSGKPLVETAATALTGSATAEHALAALRALRRSHARKSSLPVKLDELFSAHKDDTTNRQTTDKKDKKSGQGEDDGNRPEGVPDRFHNTYHFIPLEAADVPPWATVENFKDASKWRDEKGIGIHSHAHYASDTEAAPVFSGRIECTLTAETPFIVGGERAPNTDGSTTVKPYEINGAHTVPASSLKGMIGSIAEAVSGSAMRVLDTTSIISFRKSADAPLHSLGRVFADQNGGLHVYPMVEKTRQNGTGHFERVKPSQAGLDPDGSLKLAALMSPTHHGARKIEVRHQGQVVEKRELKILALPEASESKATSLAVSENATLAFKTLADERTLAFRERDVQSPPLDFNSPEFRSLALSVHPYHLVTSQRPSVGANWQIKKNWAKRNNNENPKTLFEQLQLRPRDGDIIYFKVKSDGKTVDEFAYSQIWRGLVMYKGRPANYADFLPNSEFAPFSKLRKSISAAEFLLGFVQDDGKAKKRQSDNSNQSDPEQALAFAGKLRFHDTALSAAKVSVATSLKILANPKPPSPALYFNGEKEPEYIRKGGLAVGKHALRGRKHYLHALGVSTGAVSLLQTNGQPIKQGTNGRLPWVASPPDPDPKKSDAKQRTHAHLIEKGASGTVRIDFDNLTQSELQLIAFSLRPDAHYRHKLGMGKAIGLGTVRIDPVAICLVDRLKRYGGDVLVAERFHYVAKGSGWLASLAAAHSQLKADGKTKTAILALGNPANVKYAVHTPQVRGHSIEKETYRWFVKNDSSAAGATHQCLGDIKSTTDELPTLERMEP